MVLLPPVALIVSLVALAWPESRRRAILGVVLSAGMLVFFWGRFLL